jgi:hypothetical protein
LSRADDEIDRDTAVVESDEKTPLTENVSVELPMSAPGGVQNTEVLDDTNGYVTDAYVEQLVADVRRWRDIHEKGVVNRNGLNVPYLNQNTVPSIRFGEHRTVPIGQVACGCTSVAMVLAASGKIKSDTASMQAAVHACFKKTSAPRIGVKAPEIFVRYLKSLGYGGAAFFSAPGSDRFLFDVMKLALKSSGPQIISTTDARGGRHYRVVLAIVPGADGDSNNPETAQLVVHDPNGRWEECRIKQVPGGGKCYNDPRGDGSLQTISFAEVSLYGMRYYLVR